MDRISKEDRALLAAHRKETARLVRAAALRDETRLMDLALQQLGMAVIWQEDWRTMSDQHRQDVRECIRKWWAAVEGVVRPR